MERVKIRRFDVGNGGATMKKGGEFVHINDLKLLLREIKGSREWYKKEVEKQKKEWSEKGVKPCNLDTYKGIVEATESIMSDFRDALGED